MKKLLFLSICVATALTACTGDKAINEAAQRDRDSLMQVISQRDAELDEIMGTVNEINEGFRQINEAQGRVTSEAANGEGANMKTQIQENIQFIQQTLQQNREQLEKLKTRLKNSTFEGTKLKETIDQLTAQLEEKSAQIEALQSELASKNITIEEQTQKIEQLNTNVTELTTQNEEKAKVVAEQDKQLNTAWFVFGTKSELKEQNILNKKEVLKDGAFNKNYFTEIDIRTQKEIKLYSKSAKLLTSHPSGSYTLAKDSKGQYVLKINNPNTFWSVSRYLVIQVK
jgi:chromosome segregation ATPase